MSVVGSEDQPEGLFVRDRTEKGRENLEKNLDLNLG